MSAVEIANLSHTIGNKEILKNINFTLSKDSISCILGPSGSGKTSLLKLIAGLERVQNGSIKINSKEVSSKSKHLPTEKRNIGFLFQDYALFPHLTVRQNLDSPVNYKTSPHTIEDIIKLIKLPNSLNKYPHELSGGQQQRIMIAIAIAKNPDLIIADEATSSLDSLVKKDILNLLIELKKELSLIHI